MIDSVSFHDGRVTLHRGNCLEILDTLEPDSLDSCVCDPPYHLTSIVKRFGAEDAAQAQHGTDGAYARASRGFMGKQWDGGDVAFQPATWAKVLRVLKPGAYIVAFSSSRTFGRMSVALEDAGFVNHPLIGWIFATGFPKATRIKAPGYDGFRYGGQALKPALEPIYVGQKPFSEDNGTANILKHGTGALNIDGCRVGQREPRLLNRNASIGFGGSSAQGSVLDGSQGRWPANLVHDGSDEALACFPEVHGAGAARLEPGGGEYDGSDNADWGNIGKNRKGFRIGDSGSAARFFYQAKADSDDRLNSKHPTVKPLDLMRWLVRLVTPPKGIILDPFAGTGTTGHAALIEGMRAVLIEREPEYQADIERRMDLVFSGPDERARKLAIRDDSLLPLFGGAL